MEYFVLFWVILSAIAAWIARAKGRSGLGVFFLSLLATPVVGFIVAASVKPKSQTQPTSRSGKTTGPKADDAVSLEDLGISISVSTSFGDDLYEHKPRVKGRPSKIQDCWVPRNQTVTIKGYEISGGMLYVGKNLPAVCEWHGIEPALIDPSLTVDKKHLDRPEAIGYWPSYSEINYTNRAAHLKWLAEGRADPNADISYVFLFFYGLERRALADAAGHDEARNDLPAIKAEVTRLVSVYGDNASFRGYASRFLSFVSRESLLDDEIGTPPETTQGGYDLHAALRVPIGRMARDGVGLPSDWALAWLRNAQDLNLRTPGQRCADEFDKLFLIEYRRRFPKGMKLKNCRRRIQMSYHPASSSFSGQLSQAYDLPDVTSLVGPKGKLQDLANWCSDELDSYSRWLGRNPAKEGDLAAAALLPADLLVHDAPRQLIDLKARVEQGLADESFAVMGARDVLEVWLPDDGSKQSKKMAVEGVRLLGRVGIGVEPDVRFGGRRLSNGEEVVVFRLSEGDTEVASPQYGAATGLMQLATMVSAADGEISEDEETLLKDYVAQGLQLADSEQKRLSAHLQWLLRNPPSGTGLKRRMQVIPITQREAVGRFLVSVAWADGHVNPDEVKSLTKIYKTLGLNAGLVHQHIHDVRSAGDGGPVTVVAADKVKTYKIPLERPAGVELDRDKIAAMQKESLEVSRIIGEIFEDEDEHVVQQPVPQEESADTIRGLDKKHSQLLVRLGRQSSWARSDYETLVEDIGLFPDGALEILNETAYDVCDESLTDGEDPIVINQEVYREVAS